MPPLRSLTLWMPLALFASWSIARPVFACGGTFCDSGPQAMPVDQRGENILFVSLPGKVEAHIQIQYKGDAAHFAWVLPVPALPEVEVGSQALFQNLLSATVPRYGLGYLSDCSNSGAITPRGPGAPVSIDGGGGGSLMVVQKSVGAFEVSVLRGGAASEVTEWLELNGYAMPGNAPELIGDYVARGFLFVAVKLAGGAGIDEIHPLVVRYAGTEPCVPLKLTAVAAVEDMGVRTFFLGSSRVVPKNYKHVVLNPVTINWLNFADNYEEAISAAADSPVANGHAFVTEYAGTSGVVTAPPVSGSWDAAAFVGSRVIDVIARLQSQNLVGSCGGGSCTYNHPLVLPLLRTYVPVPAGVDEGGFYNCLACYRDLIDTAAWGDGTAFARALLERIIVPARHAADVLAANPYLTRMYTTISPAEMTEDPTFAARDGLPDVLNVQFATLRTRCDGGSGVILPDGREVGLASMIDPASPRVAPTAGWPKLSAEMPWALRVEDFTGTGGAPLVLVDNAALIDRVLGEWNEATGWRPEGVDAGAGVALVITGPTADGGSAEAAAPHPEEAIASAGCACSLPRHERAPRRAALASLFLASAALALRTRRRSTTSP